MHTHLCRTITSCIDKVSGAGQNLCIIHLLSHMPTSCKHPQVRVVAREEDAEFVECQLCGEVFDSSEFPDILNEEDGTDDEAAERKRA